jgi:hypothetical protein
VMHEAVGWSEDDRFLRRAHEREVEERHDRERPRLRREHVMPSVPLLVGRDRVRMEAGPRPTGDETMDGRPEIARPETFASGRTGRW